jgi:hypothetical protein
LQPVRALGAAQVKWPRMSRLIMIMTWLARVAVSGLVFAGASGAQPGQTLEITSPTEGAVIYSGQTLAVTVKADASAFRSVTAYIPGNGARMAELAGPPYQFSIPVSPEIPSGPNKSLMAVGIPKSGGDPVYAAIDVDIERPDLPRRLKLNLEIIRFGFVGEEAPQSVTGVFADGSLAGLEDSTYTSYSSDTPAVATVDWRGMATAVAPGKANITITYAPPSIGSIAVRVPVTVPPPIVVSPPTSSLHASQTELFVASLAMNPNLDQSVRWSIYPALGSIDDTGLYAAPSSVAARESVTVTATSVADPTKSGSAKVWILPRLAKK